MFFAWQIDKEKQFLEDMALEGYILSKVRFGKYEFEECEQKSVTFQFDFQILHKNKEEEYLSFFKDWNFVEDLDRGTIFIIHIPKKNR